MPFHIIFIEYSIIFKAGVNFATMLESQKVSFQSRSDFVVVCVLEVILPPSVTNHTILTTLRPMKRCK